MLYHDAVAGNVYISENEGKSWDVVKDVPKASAEQLVEHPFDNRYVCPDTQPSIITKNLPSLHTSRRSSSLVELHTIVQRIEAARGIRLRFPLNLPSQVPRCLSTPTQVKSTTSSTKAQDARVLACFSVPATTRCVLGLYMSGPAFL